MSRTTEQHAQQSFQHSTLSLDHPSAAAARSESDDPTFDAVWSQVSTTHTTGRGAHLKRCLVSLFTTGWIAVTDESMAAAREVYENGGSPADAMFEMCDRFQVNFDDPAADALVDEIVLDEPVTVCKPTNTNKEIPMSTTQYDSGLLVDDDATVAEQIDAAGIEVVATSIIASAPDSHADDLAEDPAGTFDPSKFGMSEVLDEDEMALVRTFTRKWEDFDAKETNPLYETQVFLDGDVGVTRLFVGWLGNQPAVAHTVLVSEDGYDTNVPTHVKVFHDIDDASAWAKQFRPKPTPAEIAAKEAERLAGAKKMLARLIAT